MKQNTKHTGLQGEQLVVDYLVKDGCEIIARNYTKRFGEVDIIAQDHDTIRFIEVKTRCNPLFDPAELISRAKQKRIIAVAKDFMAKHTASDMVSCRFDVAFVVKNDQTVTVSYIENAFME